MNNAAPHAGWTFRTVLATVLLTLPGGQVQGGAAAQPPGDDEKRPELTVATYNVNYALTDEARLKLVVQNIRKAQADIVAIQEGNTAAWVYLRRHLGRDYPHMKFHRGRWAAGGMAWLSKHELLRHRIVPSKEQWFDATLVDVRLGSRPNDAGLSDVLKGFAQSEDIRQREIGYFTSKLPADAPAVILGDLNSLPSFLAPQLLAAKGYTDSYASANPDKKFQQTWEGGRGDQKWRVRIDYIYHTAHLVTRNSRVIEAGPSDHFPMLSRLALAPISASRPASHPAK